MAIQDTDPERRNLVVCSMAFIIYYYGEATFPDSAIRLQIINAHFQNIQFLVGLAWAVIFWFLYRYWLSHSGDFKRHYSGELQKFINEPFIQKFVSKVVSGPIAKKPDTDGYVVSGIWNRKAHVVVEYKYGQQIEWQSDKKPRKYVVLGSYSGEAPIGGALGIAGKIYLNAKCAFMYPSFSNYLFPYLLFIVAMLGAILKI